MTRDLGSPESVFVAKRQPEWDRLHAIVCEVQARGLARLAPEDLTRLAPLYRDVCADLARAQAARYGAPLLEYLQALTAAAHTVVYSPAARARWRSGRRERGLGLRLALEAFPRAVRRHRTAVLVALLLFFVPFAAGLGASLADPHFAARIVPESMLRPLLQAYEEGFASGRGAGVDAGMAGFYVQHNVGIALRCFATGVTLGLGSAFYLVDNGLSTGAIIGYVAAHGAGANILTFVVGHSALELGAIVLAGAAGLSLGWAIVAPGDLPRLASLQRAARSVVVIVFGATVMLVLAAAVEGFWSASSVPSSTKRVLGAVVFGVVLLYLGLAGRGSEDRPAWGGEEAARWT